MSRSFLLENFHKSVFNILLILRNSFTILSHIENIVVESCDVLGVDPKALLQENKAIHEECQRAYDDIQCGSSSPNRVDLHHSFPVSCHPISFFLHVLFLAKQDALLSMMPCVMTSVGGML